MPGNDWENYSKLVLAELTRLNTCLNNTKKDLIKVRLDLAAMRVRSGIVWGVMGASISILVASLVGVLLRK